MNLFWKKKSKEEEPIVRLAKCILSAAVASGASKIVFGFPPEDGFARIPLQSEAGQRTHEWEEDEIKRYAAENGLPVVPDHPEMLSLHCWFTVEHTHREVNSLPAYIYFDLLEILKNWHDDRIMSQVAARQARGQSGMR